MMICSLTSFQGSQGLQGLHSLRFTWLAAGCWLLAFVRCGGCLILAAIMTTSSVGVVFHASRRGMGLAGPRWALGGLSEV